MKRILFFLIFINYISVFSQNHIPNGNFESFSSCPTDFGQIDSSIYWYTPSIYSNTSDYYNQCANIDIGVPINWGGYQQAHSGVAYAGITLRENTNFREYIEVPLDTVLIKKVCYHFEMYVNLANKCNSTTNSIGVYFSDTAVTGINNSLPLPFTPQINNNAGYITDTLNWTLISGDYNATGNEKYIIIGNFNDDSHSSFLTVNPNGQDITYFYIDDVSLIPCQVGVIDLNDVKNNIKVYPNPANNMLNIESNTELSGMLTIYNSLGKPVKSITVSGTKITIPVEDLSSGLYIIKINDNKIRFSIVK